MRQLGNYLFEVDKTNKIKDMSAFAKSMYTTAFLGMDYPKSCALICTCTMASEKLVPHELAEPIMFRQEYKIDCAILTRIGKVQDSWRASKQQ